MDNAEQAPRVPNRGSFDTASLLAQSPSSVPSPLPHLTHSPSAFSVLGRNVLVPPLLPSSSAKSDPPSTKSSNKMCSSILHQSASDALSSLASSSAGSCGWWSASSPIVSTADFSGCGVTPISDPFTRAGLCGRSLAAAAASHVALTQPRRIVEEVLGHLYAKPASAELKAESQNSGLHDSQISNSSPSLSSDGQSPAQLSCLSVMPTEKDFKSSSEKPITSNSTQLVIPSVLSVPSTSLLKTASKKLEEANSLIGVPNPQKVRKKRSPKINNSAGSPKNGKKPRANVERNKSRSSRKPKEKAAKTLSSESGSHGDSSSGISAGTAGVGTSGSSDSTDEEEREKEMARLKKQQKELRRKVKELKQASHDCSQQKFDLHNKKVLPTPKSASSPKLNHSKRPVPSPAHSASILAISPKTTPLKTKINAGIIDDDVNLSVPLDLCVKKQEPTFEVSSSSFHNSFSPLISTVKKQLHMSPFGHQPDHKYPLHTSSASASSSTTPKRRGRKPKYLTASNVTPEMAHQFKQNNVHDLSNMLLPQKLLPTPSNISRNADNLLKKNSNSADTTSKPPSLHIASGLANPLNIPRKNFTLDSLLGESNGTMDAENHANMMASSSLSNLRGKERLRYSNRIKRLEERSREFETFSKGDTSSGTDSDQDNDHSDSEESITGSVSTSAGQKRSCDEDGEDYGGKRRRVVPDEREIQIPLELGWRRETRIRCFSRAGVRGEVIYYTPCGKKLRSYPEVVRYLLKNGITDISRENFTFSTKVNIGDFLEVTSNSNGGEEYVLLNEQEVIARISEVRARKGRLGVQGRKGSHPRSSEQEEQQRQWEQKQLQHQLEQQAEEVRRQKEQQRILKQQERFERLEQLRIEREIRAQQAIEEQELKRQQAAFLREQERERRRQHMMLVRALENRKKQEERERKREEILYEKRINREKKMEQRRIELDYLRELKKPVEDMVLKDNAPFPEFSRIKGVKLSGKPFADILMVFEFLHNFGETLGFDVDNLPSLNTLQMAVLNLDEKLEEELLSITHHLLACAIEDPGVPHCPEAQNVLGQNLKDVDITNNNVSEVLRLYFTAQDKRSNMCHWLQAKPFLCLNATQKTEILAYICDDLLGSRVLMRKIDSNIENVNTLRKDKWLIEGDLRRLKTVQQRRLLKAKQQTYEESKMNLSQNSTLPCDPSNISRDNGTDHSELKDNSECDKEKLDDLDNDNDSANESDEERNENQVHIIVSDGEDEDLQLSNEELSKKLDKLTKQLTSYSNKLTKALHTIRAVTFGQDRYHRRYWVLPKSGGVYVESMESSELPENICEILEASTKCVESQAEDSKEMEAEIKQENSEHVELKADDIDKEEMNTEPKEHCEENILPKQEEDEITEPSEQVKVKEEQDSTDIEMKIENEEENNLSVIPLDLNKSPENLVEESEMQVCELPKEEEEEEAEKCSDTKEGNMEQESTCGILELTLKKEYKEKPEKKPSKGCLNKDDMSESKKEKKPEVNIFMPKFCNNADLDNCNSLNHTNLPNSGDRKQSNTLNSSLPTNQNWLLHSPFFASLLAGNLMFNGPMIPGRESNGTYFNLPKNDCHNPFGPFLGTPSMLTPEQLYKSLNDKSSNQKPWFSILPRMPCDEDSMPKQQLIKNLFGSSPMYTPSNVFPANATASNSGKSLAQNSSHSTQAHLSNLQMEILNGVPPGFFLHPFLSHQFGPSFPGGMPNGNSTNASFNPSVSHSTPAGDFGLNLGRPPASSTPSSIPTPSATPGPSQGCSTPTFRDSPTPSIKRLMMEKMTQEYERPKPIPLELQKGWWRIVDPTHLKDLVNSLHHRGIREKILQKFIQKHFNYACNSCSQGHDEDVTLEETVLDESIAELPGGVPLVDNIDEWSREVALRVDLAILEQIENLEEKIDGASMQVKGWKPPPKLSLDPHSKFIPACELYLQIKCDIPDSPREKNPKKSGKKISARKRRSDAKKRAQEQAELAAAAKAELEEAEGEEKPEESPVDNAGDKSKNPEEIEPEKGIEDMIVLPPGKVNPVEEAKARLLMVEAAIERRYLKPPLGYSANDLNRSALAGNHQSSPDGNEEDTIPAGLQKWRNAVQVCRSSSQLAMCINYLENFTAWDKSIMRASCQFCHSGENEEMLLLCDGCDKGYHTYCFKPKMEKIPEGDWYCYECLNKATGDNVCVICGKKGKLIDCAACPKCFHLTCLEPPLGKMPKGKWYCSGCGQTRPTKKSQKKTPPSKDREKEPKEPTSSKKVEPEPKPVKPKAEKKERKKEIRNQVSEDFAPCRALVEEMEKHDDSWPFLSPVNTKQFPTYRKVIKKPMDLATVRGRLDSAMYKGKEDFANDVRLIFDNCETFNEDDSPVGQAGHTMRAFFNSRWSEISPT